MAAPDDFLISVLLYENVLHLTDFAMNFALVFLQISIWDDREHSLPVWEHLEGLISLLPQPEYASARPM